MMHLYKNFLPDQRVLVGCLIHIARKDFYPSVQMIFLHKLPFNAKIIVGVIIDDYLKVSYFTKGAMLECLFI